MARKFQMGDVVQVVKDLIGGSLVSTFKVGHRGKVIGYVTANQPEPYEVKRNTGYSCWFGVKELKLIKRKNQEKNHGKS